MRVKQFRIVKTKQSLQKFFIYIVNKYVTFGGPWERVTVRAGGKTSVSERIQTTKSK